MMPCKHVIKKLICQRVVYDALQACGKEICEIEIYQKLRKSYLLSFKSINRKWKEKQMKSRKQTDMKRKLKMNEITTMKRQNITIQCSTEALKEGIFTETLAADKKQDLSLTAKAAYFCWSLKDNKTMKRIL